MQSVSLDEHAQAVAAALAANHPLPMGRLLGLPELEDADYWVDIAGASVILRVKPKTITSWLALEGPAASPLPRPSRILYRLYWRRSDLDAWLSSRVSDPGPASRRRLPRQG